MQKRIWEILVIILINLMLLCAAGDSAAQRIFRPAEYAYSVLGDRSDEVEQIQRQLKKRNYYDGEADGFFGLTTKSALRRFQRENGLDPNGEADEKTLSALGIGTKNLTSLCDADFELLARFAQAQCGSDSAYGKMAQIAQLLEAANGPCAPESVAAVLFQKGRYECVDESFSELHPDEACRSAVFFLCG